MVSDFKASFGQLALYHSIMFLEIYVYWYTELLIFSLLYSTLCCVAVQLFTYPPLVNF